MYRESRLDYEWLFAAEGHSSIRRSVGWGERGFVEGIRISSLVDEAQGHYCRSFSLSNGSEENWAKKKQGMLGRFGLCLRLERGSTLIQHTWNAVETAVMDDER